MSIRICSSTELVKLNGVKILGYGGSGVGKTRLCATAPSPLIISVEGGLLSLVKENVPAIEIHSLAELAEVYRWAYSSTEAWLYATLCLDSLSEIAEVCLAEGKTTNKDPRKAYGEMLDQMMTLVKAFRDLPGRNVYMTAKMEWQKDEAAAVSRYLPSMPGQKLGPSLPYLFDEVFHIGVGQTPDGKKFNYIQAEADFQHVAKDRSGALAPYEEPDLSKIIAKIIGGK